VSSIRAILVSTAVTALLVLGGCGDAPIDLGSSEAGVDAVGSPGAALDGAAGQDSEEGDPCDPDAAVCGSESDAAEPENCTTDADCQLFPYACAECACYALARGAALPACPTPLVTCFADPCQGQRATCASGVCTLGE
jgi:hypothetical protein